MDCLSTPLQVVSPEMDDNSSSSPAAIIGSNNDLLIEIFLRIPARSLILMKSVSKRWFSLISSTSFSVLHTLRHPTRVNPTSLFFRRSPRELYHLPIKPGNCSQGQWIPDFSAFIEHSCNGLFLCRDILVNNHYYVYNHTNKRRRVVDLDRRGAVFGASLAFDPSKSPHYKVICVVSSGFSDYSHRIEIYDSKIHSWSCPGDPFRAPDDMNFFNGVYWNDAIHWIRSRGDSMYFNVEKGVIGRLPGVPFSGSRWGVQGRSTYFGECNGELLFASSYGSALLVFKLEKDYSAWSVMYRVDVNEAFSAFPQVMSHSLFILAVVREESEEETLLLVHVPGQVVAYKLNAKTFDVLAELGIEDFYGEDHLQFGSFDAFKFIATLAPV